MTILELSEQLREGKITCTGLAEACLRAIAENDRNGKALNSVAELDPNVLFCARALDAELRAGKTRGPLHGIPVLLKDNIDVKGLHTTAGSLALDDLIAQEDAPVAARLREAGALILGKTNLSEFAHYMAIGAPSGYSSRGGQVIHAYDPTVNPSGSSSGSAVAVSARFAPVTIGTETDGSLMYPASINAVCTIKPTVGLVPRTGIVPISHVQDTAGPMATSVDDLALVLQAIAGPDGTDAAAESCTVKDYTAALNADGAGLTVGICRSGADEAALACIDRAEHILRRAGASLRFLDFEDTRLEDWAVFPWEFKYGIDLYLSQHESKCRSLGDIVAFNAADPGRCLRYGQDLLEVSEKAGGRLCDADYITRRLDLERESHRLLDGTMKAAGVDCLLTAAKFPRGNLAPVSGNPCLSMPAVKTDEAAFAPLSYMLLGLPCGEDALLHTAYILQQALGIENRPGWVDMPF